MDAFAIMKSVKCQLKDYYKDGVSIPKFLDLLEAFYYGREISSSANIKKWELPYLKKNMWVLGFFEGVPSSGLYGISPRGLSLLSCRTLRTHKIISSEIENEMARFVLLKAIADIDWDCFSTLLIEHYINGKPPREIRRLYFPYDKGQNFSHRWGFHRKILEEIDFPSVIRRFTFPLNHDTVSALNPYSENFDASIFFNKKLSTASTENLRTVLLKSIKIYSKFFRKDFPFAYCEVLKTIIQSILLSRNLFLNEPALCKVLIHQMISMKIPLHRSSKGIATTGRGFYVWKEGRGVSYIFFEVPNTKIKA